MDLQIGRIIIMHVTDTGDELIFSFECIQFICECVDKGKALHKIAKAIGCEEAPLKTVVKKLKTLGRIGVRKRGGSFMEGAVPVWDVPPNPEIQVGAMTVKKLRKYTKTFTNNSPVKKETKDDFFKPEPELTELLSDLSNAQEKEIISTHHKELLIEVLHKLIC